MEQKFIKGTWSHQNNVIKVGTVEGSDEFQLEFIQNEVDQTRENGIVMFIGRSDFEILIEGFRQILEHKYNINAETGKEE